MSQFIDSLRAVNDNYKTYDEWEQAQSDDVAKRKYLAQKLDLPKDKLEITKAKADTVLRAVSILDKKSENNCEDMEQFTSTIGLFAILPLSFASLIPMLARVKGFKVSKKQEHMLTLAQIPLVTIAGIGLSLWGNSKQKDASRIGRFQARQGELKDAKNFVIYTPEQIEAAKIIAKNMPDAKDDKSFMQIFSNLKQISQDEKAYKKWVEERVKNPEDVQKVLNAKFTPEQLAQGEEDKEIIVNVVKDINNKAEEYSENCENAFDTMGSLSVVGAAPIAYGLNKILKIFKNVTPTTRIAVSVFAPLIFTLSLLGFGTSEQKTAASVGRFKKKKEILENPELVMSYSKEQLDSAKNIKAPKVNNGMLAGIFDDFKFLKTYINEKKEYNDYLKTDAKQEDKINAVLKQSEVSNAQLKDAKQMQKKVFNTFDKMDEMSQRYSEDVEAGSEIAKQLFAFAFDVIALVPILGIPLMANKGKLPVHKIINGFSHLILQEKSSLRKVIDEAYSVVDNDKELKQSLSKSLISQDEFKVLENNKKFKPVIDSLHNELLKYPDLFKSGDLMSGLKKIASENFKQDPISKWARNLVFDIGKLKSRNMMKIAGVSENSEEFKSLDIKFKNYKTLFGSAIAGAVPILGILGGIPFAFNSWLTNVQKKAGKIGVMKAMEEVDKPELFVNSEN